MHCCVVLCCEVGKDSAGWNHKRCLNHAQQLYDYPQELSALGGCQPPGSVSPWGLQRQQDNVVFRRCVQVVLGSRTSAQRTISAALEKCMLLCSSLDSMPVRYFTSTANKYWLPGKCRGVQYYAWSTLYYAWSTLRPVSLQLLVPLDITGLLPT
jgi:hypothetical protein